MNVICAAVARVFDVGFQGLEVVSGTPYPFGIKHRNGINYIAKKIQKYARAIYLLIISI